MPTPVGPVSPDPDDPDLWDEWYETDDEGDDLPSRFGWPVRLTALLVAVAFAALLIASR